MKISAGNIGQRLILYLVPIMIIIFAVHSFIDIQSVTQDLTDILVKQTLEMSNSIIYSVNTTMFMANSIDREEVTHDLTETLKEIQGQFGVSRIDVFSKRGDIVASTDEASIGTRKGLNSTACSGCHEPNNSPGFAAPASIDSVASIKGDNNISIFLPIKNQPACYNSDCHIHSPDQNINGVMSVAVPLMPVKMAVANMRNRLVISSISLILLLSLISAFMINKVIKRPLNQLIHSMRMISSGNLNAKLDFNKSGHKTTELSERLDSSQRNGRFRNELDRVAHAYAGMIDQLTRLLSHIRDVSVRITTAGEELNAASEQQAQESKIQYKKIARSIETALKVSKHAEEIEASLKSLHDSAEKALEGTKNMRSIIRATSNKMENLGEQTKQIGKMADLIHSIAEETNLLALNAAIEAAHAGEHGAGFAVVAEEVRRLADRSTEATREITVITNSIMGEVEESVSRMEKTTNEVLANANIAREASELSKEVSSIALKQLSGGKEIQETLKEAKEIIEQFASGAQQTAKASDDLMNVALELQSISEQIQLAETK